VELFYSSVGMTQIAWLRMCWWCGCC
jgi:hypothetical protein